MDYYEALDWLATLPDFERTGEFSARGDVAPMRALLAALGDPHHGRATVHIAGSKGKGSTGAIAESILRAAGVATGYYISPHLHRYNERIRTGGAAIDPGAFGAALGRVRDEVAGIEARFPGRRLIAFDALTAAAFLAFTDAGMRAQIIEVGLGGTLDSTNVFGRTDVVVITPISLEHTAILGATIAEIAAQKCGIITPGATVVVAPQRESALDVVRATAAGRDARVVEVVAACQVARTSASIDAQEIKLKTPRATYAAKLALIGRHQIDNAAAAVLACEELAPALGIELSARHVQEGLASVRWPARLEVIRRSPLVIIDGAHNGDSAKRMVAALREHAGAARATFVLGTLADKDIAAMAGAIAPVADAVLAPAWAHVRAADARGVAAACREAGADATVFPGIASAMEAANERAGARGAVVAFGSLAFAAAVREYLLGIESDMIRQAFR